MREPPGSRLALLPSGELRGRAASAGAPIFILGILPRSGTNFLWDLLRLHPDCTVPDKIWEPHFLHFSAPLRQYAERLERRWSLHGSVEEEDVAGSADAMCAEIGRGLLRFLRSRSDEGRLLLKTPSVVNLPRFFDFFGEAHLLILVRDGRSVVESGVRTFGWRYEESFRRWAAAARTILDFLDRFEPADAEKSVLLVRYEDLVRDGRGEIRRILDFADLDPARYDFSSIGDLPVRGSAFFRGGAEEVHWDAVRKTKEFRPLERWADWPPSRHRRFNWIAGDALERLGYTPEPVYATGPLSRLGHRSRDLRWRTERTGRRLRRLLRSVRDRLTTAA